MRATGKILILVTHWKEPYTKPAMVREKLCYKEIDSLVTHHLGFEWGGGGESKAMSSEDLEAVTCKQIYLGRI